ncbi:sensor histidine kinase [Roseicella aerolata]|uniref:histidine kinase n=1 Tax=Roseicella aerolata TaxID=2883479 RepID=A0A9X1IEI0_9PROT|nr:PAS domain-containing protein [Roseicella aerolata]MCB4821833.1 PAS domain-containing protein [Roseicella aerolata]
MTPLPDIERPSLGSLGAALDLVPVATLLLDWPGLRAIAGNDEAARLLGSARDRLPQVWEGTLAAAAGAALRSRLGAVTARETPEVFDACLAPPGGAPLTVLVRARRLEVEGRSLLSAGLVDITRRQNVEARLAMAHRQLEIALAGAELGAWQRDLREEVLQVSPRWCTMLGLPPGLGIIPVATWRQLVHPDDLPRLEAIVAAHIASEQGRYEVEIRLRHADGRWIPVLSRGEAIERDAEGHALVIVGTHFELSAQRASELARAASEREARRRLAELETLYRSAPLGLAQFDREFRFVRVNEAMAEINGLPVEAHLGHLAWALVPDLREAAEPLMRRVLEQRETITGIEFSGETPKAPGVKRDWIEQFYPVRDPETQEVVGLGVVCEEVTERKQAERTRELLLRELDHRVKNLFAIVNGLVAYSARGAASSQAMRDALLGRVGALARAHDLVRPAIAGDAGRQSGTTLPGLLQVLLAPFQGGHALPERLRLHGPALPLGPNAAPPIALALHELATNAAKYGALSRAGGRVAIDWETQDGSLRLRWMEAGGPPAAAPGASGFGHRLVTQSAAQLGGSAAFDWTEDGLRVELRLPLARLAN